MLRQGFWWWKNFKNIVRNWFGKLPKKITLPLRIINGLKTLKVCTTAVKLWFCNEFCFIWFVFTFHFSRSHKCLGFPVFLTTNHRYFLIFEIFHRFRKQMHRYRKVIWHSQMQEVRNLDLRTVQRNVLFVDDFIATLIILWRNLLRYEQNGNSGVISTNIKPESFSEIGFMLKSI